MANAVFVPQQAGRYRVTLFYQDLAQSGELRCWHFGIPASSGEVAIDQAIDEFHHLEAIADLHCPVVGVQCHQFEDPKKKRRSRRVTSPLVRLH